jgi:hypothetical protein
MKEAIADASVRIVVIQKVDLGRRAHRDGEKVDEKQQPGWYLD